MLYILVWYDNSILIKLDVLKKGFLITREDSAQIAFTVGHSFDYFPV